MIANRRLQRITVTLLTILSLLASSVAACTCSHHQTEVKPTVVPPCHHEAEMAQMTENGDPQVEDTSNRIATDDDCACVETAQKQLAKSESVKLKKYVALATVEAALAVSLVSSPQPTHIGLIKPIYLPDSFYELSPSRGPPARL